MKRRHFISGAIAAPFILSGNSVLAAKQSLEDLSDYMNTLTTAKGTFVQRNPDGSRSNGQFYMHRPGRMRFEYESPNNSLVVVSGGAVLVLDKKSNTAAKQYPIGQSPLSLLLAKEVDLTRKGLVYKHTTQSNTTTIHARDPKNPKVGTIQVTFTHDPIVLNNWIITDQSGKRTKMTLKSLTKGGRIPSKLFDMKAARKLAK